MTLRGKLVALVVGLTAALLAGVGLLLSGSWSGWSSGAVEDELRARAGRLGHLIELEDGRVQLDEDDAEALHDPTHPWRILGSRGEPLGGAGELAWPPPDPDRVQVARDRRGRELTVVTRTVAVDKHGRHARAVIQVAGLAAPYRGLELQFRRGLLWALGGALLVAGLGAGLLAHLSLAPLRRLAAEVDAIGASSLDRRLGTAGLDPELRRVAVAFDGLLARLEAAMRQERQLVARASHALRTPTATILTRAEVALRRERDAAAYREALADVATAARESSALVAHLLTLSRLDEAGGVARREPVPLAEVAGEVGRLLAPRAAEAGVALELAVPEGLAALGDRAAVRELLEALLDNALRYTPRGGSAGVRGAAGPGGCRLVVWDTGPGIPPAERERAFERFFRGGAAQATGAAGSGLGLAIVKAIADAHGGRVALGERPGGGLEVELSLPGAPRGGTGATAGGERAAAAPRPR